MRPDMAFRKQFILTLKILVTLSLCGLILWQADWQKIAQTFRNADPALILTAFLCMVLNVSISAFKWMVLLKLHGEQFSFTKLRNYYFSAVFFNNFLPSSIGGDSYRIYKTYQRSTSKTAAILAVVSERLTGIIALVVLGLMGGIVVWFRSSVERTEIETVIVVFSVIIFVTAVLLIFSRQIFAWLINHPKFPGKIKTLLDHLGDYRRHPAMTCQVMGLSFFFHIFTFFWMLLLIAAVGGTLDVFSLVVAVAISNLVAVLPISINGIGLMDGSFIYVASRLGMDFSLALMVMLIIRALLIVLSLIGGIYYLKERKTLDINKIRQQTV